MKSVVAGAAVIVVLFMGCVPSTHPSQPCGEGMRAAASPIVAAVGCWYDLVIASPGNRTQAGFLVPAPGGRVTLASVVASGAFYGDSLERAYLMRERGLSTLRDAGPVLCADAQLSSKFVDGRLFHQFDPSWPIDEAEVKTLQRAVFFGAKGVAIARAVGQSPDGTAGFFIWDRNHHYRAPIGQELLTARFFHSLDEAVKLAKEHGCRRVYPADVRMLDSVWLEPFPRNQLPASFRDYGDGRTP